MRILLQTHFLLLLLMALPGTTLAQIRGEVDSNGSERAAELFSKAMGDNSLLFTGIEYRGYHPRIRGHAYYATDSLINGDVFFDGVLYKNYLVRYDLVQDQLLVYQNPETRPIQLIREKVGFFRLNDAQFIRMVKDSTAGSTNETGFYQLLHRGKMVAVAKLRKQIIESRRADELSRFALYTEFFVKKGDNFHRVKTNGQLIALMKDRRDEIRRFQREKALRFKKDPVATISQTVAYYDQFTK